ncbi:uncharacterized protein LOC100275314 [Zea mays]|uniref:Uncharacterized protein n=2 Tax=Zea mays TaxID=4577 RepID=A0A1D6KWL1_MAIZE|nr:uncharacterized protein LOC100275314 [Zea mays]ONM06856.1 hypothetical protein ZEAMMB73_Zm00001d033150 [Zea mays]
MHTNPAMAKAAPPLLAAGSRTAITAQQPSSRKGAAGTGLFCSRAIVSKRTRVTAKLGDGELKPAGKRKFITKEEEPEQYWQTAGEREGENPMMTPLPYIIIFGMSTPFVILAIAFANGWIKVPVR